MTAIAIAAGVVVLELLTTFEGEDLLVVTMGVVVVEGAKSLAADVVEGAVRLDCC